MGITKKAEKPRLVGHRLYAKHREAINNRKDRASKSAAQWVREAIEEKAQRENKK